MFEIIFWQCILKAQTTNCATSFFEISFLLPARPLENLTKMKRVLRYLKSVLIFMSLHLTRALGNHDGDVVQSRWWFRSVVHHQPAHICHHVLS